MSEQEETLKSLMIDGGQDSSTLDPRFQNVNVSRYCYTHYIDYQRCQYLLGENNPDCDIFKNMYRRLCPNAWINKWDEQRTKGNFPRNVHTEVN
jgi:cytochrome c oxidase subunit 6b